jgi:hypothetical protein
MVIWQAIIREGREVTIIHLIIMIMAIVIRETRKAMA